MAPPELADRLVVGARLAREEHEADVGPEALLDPPRAPHPRRIAVQEHLERVGVPPASSAILSGRDREEWGDGHHNHSAAVAGWIVAGGRADRWHCPGSG